MEVGWSFTFWYYEASGSTQTPPSQTITTTISPNQEKVVEYIATSDGSYLAQKLDSEKKVDIDLMPWIRRTVEYQVWVVKGLDGEGFTLRVMAFYEGWLKHLFWLIEVAILEMRRLIKRLRRAEEK